jgi:site-specific DNA recombinase
MMEGMNQSLGDLEPTPPSDESTSIKIRRCAIYARVSSSSRDDTPLSSIEAQIETCKAYIHAQNGMGWELIEPVYADDGYSGGTMERPALQQLFQDMKDGKIDAVVIQRLDRICRSARDISDLIPLFTIPGIALVSVNQSLDTESSQGRLMINVLTSFAQFEREQSGDRTREKISAARANGKWQHNGIPLGYYQDQNQELQVDAAEATIVEDIFQRFTEAESVDALIIDLADQGYRSKVRISQQGNRAGGKQIDRNGLYRILNNRMYLGELFYRQEWHASKHQPIIEQDLWDKVHAILDQRARRRGIPTSEHRWIIFPLGDRLYLHDGRPYKMYESSSRDGLRYSYYQGPATPQEKATGNRDDDRYLGVRCCNPCQIPLENPLGCREPILHCWHLFSLCHEIKHYQRQLGKPGLALCLAGTQAFRLPRKRLVGFAGRPLWGSEFGHVMRGVKVRYRCKAATDQAGCNCLKKIPDTHFYKLNTERENDYE